MNNVQFYVEALSRVMTNKLRLDGATPSENDLLEWERVVAGARSRNDIHILQMMLSAWDLQAMREKEEAHLSAAAMLGIWEEALSKAQDWLRKHATDSMVEEAPEHTVERVKTAAKRRLARYAEVLSYAGTGQLSHSQGLAALARADGFDSFQALSAALSQGRPTFCPYCGAPSLTERGGAYGCARCGNRFGLTQVNPASNAVPDFDKAVRAVLRKLGYEVVKLDTGDVVQYNCVHPTRARSFASTLAGAWREGWKDACLRARVKFAMPEEAWNVLPLHQQLDVVARSDEPLTK